MVYSNTATAVLKENKPLEPVVAIRGLIFFSCPSCYKRFKVDQSKAGKKAMCSGCEHVLHIPFVDQISTTLGVSVEKGRFGLLSLHLNRKSY